MRSHRSMTFDSQARQERGIRERVKQRLEKEAADKEKRQAIQSGKCFRCGHSGHIA
eukprot:CAMPEP_0169287952 /NCGR_PEP_ID=MMETSP1016-20121227/60250_1 /TAXON_ID=342587 /ORGANISM="Karlodinium micrum, Strain CCMP2283" /LENGTH=55 /DNA_ID=CAMNT_0009378049 /DNA_START=111 /DNA_END=275 /DNA_ORIENTATION=+